MKPNVINAIYEVILDRKTVPRENSYVCKLLGEGEDKILKKIGEESTEVILAAKSGDPKALVCELSDLVFHSLVLMGQKGITPEQVEEELYRRFGTSGIEEKNSRQK